MQATGPCNSYKPVLSNNIADYIREDMKQEDLTLLMRVPPSGNLTRTPQCPEYPELSAYVDGSLGDADHQRIEEHLAACVVCTRLVTLSCLQRHSKSITPTPELARARARRLAGIRKPDRVGRITTWAAVATVLLAVTFVVQWQTELGPATEASNIDRTVRTVSPAIEQPQILSPGAGVSIDTGELVFRWTEIPGSLYYDVLIVSDAGNLVWEERVTGTRWAAADTLSLSPGAEYFVRVDAYLSNTKTISSDHVAFTMSVP